MNKETTFQKIMRKTGRKPSECKCRLCKKQCASTPCLGTPEDIEKLMDAGYSDQLLYTDWGFGLYFGFINYTIPMIQAKQTDTGCIFFENGLCSLHEKGLKPTEGRLSHHSIQIDNLKFSKLISWNIAKEWTDPANTEITQRIFKKFLLNSYLNEFSKIIHESINVFIKQSI